LKELKIQVEAQTRKPEPAHGETAPLLEPEHPSSAELQERGELLAKIIAWKRRMRRRRSRSWPISNYVQAPAETLKEILSKLEAAS